MPILTGSWNTGGAAAGATGALKRIREKQEATFGPATDWINTAGHAGVMQSIVEGIVEELIANGLVIVPGVTVGPGSVTGTIT